MKKVIALLALLNVAVFAQNTFTDPRDGKKYKYVKIGNHTWMAENLNYNTKGSKCYGEEDDEKTLSAAEVQANCAKYGRLYSWKEAMEACPEGWHLSATEEWRNLIDFVGGSSVAGRELKAESERDAESERKRETITRLSEKEKLKMSEREKRKLQETFKCKWTEEKIDNRGRVTYIEHNNNCNKYGFSALSGSWWASFDHTDYPYFYSIYKSEESLYSENGVNGRDSYLFSVRCVKGQKPRACCRYEESGNCVEWCADASNAPSRSEQGGGSGNSAIQTPTVQTPKVQNSSGSLKVLSASDIDMSGDASRSKVEIMQVVASRMPGIKNIHGKYLKMKPGFSGKVTIKFTIAPGGDIVKIDILSSTTGYSNFDDAVKNMVGTWKWKAIKSGNTTVTIPFSFE